MKGDEFLIRDFNPSDSNVCILGRRFSLNDYCGHHSMAAVGDSAVPSHLIMSTISTNDPSRECYPSSGTTSPSEVNCCDMHNELEKFVDSLVFMSYRKDFPPMYRLETSDDQNVHDCSWTTTFPQGGVCNSSICPLSLLPSPPSGLPTTDVIKVTTDAGWGCTIRCTQMLVFEALKRHFRTPEHIWAVLMRDEKKESEVKTFTSTHNEPHHHCRERSGSSPTGFSVSGYQLLELPKDDISLDSDQYHGHDIDDPDLCKEGTHNTPVHNSLFQRPAPSSPLFDQMKNEMLLRWFLDVPSPPDEFPFSVYAFFQQHGSSVCGPSSTQWSQSPVPYPHHYRSTVPSCTSRESSSRSLSPFPSHSSRYCFCDDSSLNATSLYCEKPNSMIVANNNGSMWIPILSAPSTTSQHAMHLSSIPKDVISTGQPLKHADYQNNVACCDNDDPPITPAPPLEVDEHHELSRRTQLVIKSKSPSIDFTDHYHFPSVLVSPDSWSLQKASISGEFCRRHGRLCESFFVPEYIDEQSTISGKRPGDW